MGYKWVKSVFIEGSIHFEVIDIVLCLNGRNVGACKREMVVAF